MNTIAINQIWLLYILVVRNSYRLKYLNCFFRLLAFEMFYENSVAWVYYVLVYILSIRISNLNWHGRFWIINHQPTINCWNCSLLRLSSLDCRKIEKTQFGNSIHFYLLSFREIVWNMKFSKCFFSLAKMLTRQQ